MNEGRKKTAMFKSDISGLVAVASGKYGSVAMRYIAGKSAQELSQSK